MRVIRSIHLSVVIATRMPEDQAGVRVVADALREADGAPREGKPLLDFSDWAAD
jgi:hypothetical protein